MDFFQAGTSPLRLVFVVAPTLLYGIAALRPLRSHAKGGDPAVQRIALLAWLCTWLSAGCFVAYGPTTWSGPALVQLAGFGSVRPSLRADFLSSAMLLLIGSLGWVTARYSQRYLAGEDALPRYFRFLLATLCAASLLVISNNLAFLLLAWIGASLALHQLLTFYRSRPQTQLCARKKFVASRLAELMLALAFALWAGSLGTLEIDEACVQLRALEKLPPALQASALLLVLAAALKSAQLPVHGWLIQVMEAPTPVSALLHAGVVNLGGFLLLRLSDLLSSAAMANAFLLIIGSLTAGLAALVTLTRISVKVMLAWSTCAQLGFMFVECGLGAYELALLHLLAHSFYKAYAFLHAGSAVEGWRQRHLLPQPQAPSLIAWLGSGAVTVVVVAVLRIVSRGEGSASAASWVLLFLLGLALAPLLLAAARRGLSSVVGLAIALAPLVLLQHHLGQLLSSWAGLRPAGHVAPLGAIIGAALVFAALFVVQGLLWARPQSLHRLYAWFFGGLFIDDFVTGVGLRLAQRFSGSPPSPRGSRSHGGRTVGAADPASPHELTLAIDAATRFVAPTWPLDQLIAVNPFCGLGDVRFAVAAADIHLHSGAKLFMPRAYYRAAFNAGALRREHLQAAIAESGSSWTTEQLVACLADTSEPAPRLQLLCDLLDARTHANPPQRAMRWNDYVTHSIGQFCAAWFDAGQALWRMPRNGGMYRTWQAHAAADRGPSCLMGMVGYRALVRGLPESPRELIAFVVSQLAIPRSACRSYFAALLLRLGGWAAWCAHERFEAQKRGHSDDQIVDLLAIRLAWEWLLSRDPHLDDRDLVDFHAQWQRLADLRARNRAALHPDCLLQHALECAYQLPLRRALVEAPSAQAQRAAQPPAIQAVFCIDVRSEPLRRALEICCPSIQTVGFAGFFGLPIDYTALGTARAEPRLPGLLRPRLHVDESCPLATDRESVRAARRRRIVLGQHWHMLRTLANTAFTLVESCGLFYAGKLLASCLRGTRLLSAGSRRRIPMSTSERALRPTLPVGEELATLADGILRAMGITQSFARLVLLCGHGSSSQNNPQAAALQCGACGGHPGDVNARVLANLLNTSAIRAALHVRGLSIPDSTWFVAGLHDTATDEVQLFDLDQAPQSHAADLSALTNGLSHAGAINRRWRAESLKIDGHDDDAIRTSFLVRATSWEEVRPEWGLVGNSSLIVAPRQRTRGLDLAGRAFLHDYDASHDPSWQKLEQIMTAPMVVAHWISLQYYASTVDPLRYGSGNKVLHNVVGGHLGVFEGNGGDLRIGLPLQCISDGATLRHTPLRLSVFIEAPQAAIETVIARHAHIANLIRNEWLHVFQIDAEQRQIVRYHGGRFCVEPQTSSANAGPHHVAA